MKLAIVTDIHGNLAALEAVHADIKRLGCDLIVNLGDSLSGPLLPLETAQYLMSERWLCLAGNHERQILKGVESGHGLSDAFAYYRLGQTELSWLATLKHTAQLNDEVFPCHGTPTSDCEYFLESVSEAGCQMASMDEIDARSGTVNASLIACGHTHVARVASNRRGQTIVNGGSVGLPAYTDDHPFFHAVETGSPHARYAFVEQISGLWNVSLRAVSYDFRSMANLAEKHGRPDWRTALLTGFVAS